MEGSDQQNQDPTYESQVKNLAEIKKRRKE
jgi:hypothetical protein